MPELPEVETVRRGLSPVMEGRQFAKVLLNRPNLRFPFPDDFIARLENVTVDRLARRAKFLVGHLSSGETLVMHLGMSGRFIIDDGTYPADSGNDNPKHHHVVFTMTDKTMKGGQNPKTSPSTIIYNDPRRFGFMELLEKGQKGRMDDLGPEPLSNNFSGASLHSALAGKKGPIKTSLLDQHIVAGLGNIYVCEALFGAHISPLRQAGSLGAKETDALAAQIKSVLAIAIEAGGSSLKDFAATDGSLGYFQHRFQVYDRENTPCPAQSCSGTITRVKQAGRSTFWCETCQG